MGEERGGAGRLLGLEPGGDRGAPFLRNQGRVSRRPFHGGSRSPPPVGGSARQRQRLAVGLGRGGEGKSGVRVGQWASRAGGGGGSREGGAVFKLSEPLSWFALPRARAARVVAACACVGPGRADRAPVVRARGGVVVAAAARVAAHAQLAPRLVRVSRASCFGLAGEWGALRVSREGGGGAWARGRAARALGEGAGGRRASEGFAGGFPVISSQSPRLGRGN